MLKLENTYDWRIRALISGGLALLLVLGTAMSGGLGWIPIAGAVGVVLSGYYLALYVRSHGAASFDEDGVLYARNLFLTKKVKPGEVKKVKEIINGRSPDVKLCTTHGGVVVPTSKLKGGHSNLFIWLAETQPEAKFDKGAEKIRTRLIAGGYLDGTRDLLTADNWGFRDAYDVMEDKARKMLGESARRHNLSHSNLEKYLHEEYKEHQGLREGDKIKIKRKKK